MDRRRLLQTVAGAAAGLAAPAVLRAQPPLAKLRFTLDFRVTGQTAPFFLAQSKGWYAEEGLDVSIDVGLMERAGNVHVAPATFPWDDVGAWDALARTRTPDADGNVADVVTITSNVPRTGDSGTVTVIDVGDTTVGSNPASMPKFTVAPVTKPVPVRVIRAPPASRP